MVRIQVKLTEEQFKTLKYWAERQNVSVADLIRRSVDSYILNNERLTLDEKKERALSVVGALDSGIPDLSEKHDCYLAQIYGEAKQ